MSLANISIRIMNRAILYLHQIDEKSENKSIIQQLKIPVSLVFDFPLTSQPSIWP